MTALTKIADYLAKAIISMDNGEKFILMSRTEGNGLPLVAWRLKTPTHFDGRRNSLGLLVNRS